MITSSVIINVSENIYCIHTLLCGEEFHEFKTLHGYFGNSDTMHLDQTLPGLGDLFFL